MTSQKSNSTSRAISCADFQQQLPDLFASGSKGVPEDPDLVEHLNRTKEPIHKQPIYFTDEDTTNKLSVEIAMP